MAAVFERVRKIIAEQLGVEESEITPQTAFVEDLNADSLDLVELIMSLEEEFSTGRKADFNAPQRAFAEHIDLFLFDDPAVAEDHHVVAELFDFAQRVAGKESGPAVRYDPA